VINNIEYYSNIIAIYYCNIILINIILNNRVTLNNVSTSHLIDVKDTIKISQNYNYSIIIYIRVKIAMELF